MEEAWTPEMEARLDKLKLEMKTAMATLATAMKDQIHISIATAIAAIKEQNPSRGKSRSQLHRHSRSSHSPTRATTSIPSSPPVSPSPQSSIPSTRSQISYQSLASSSTSPVDSHPLPSSASQTLTQVVSQSSQILSQSDLQCLQVSPHTSSHSAQASSPKMKLRPTEPGLDDDDSNCRISVKSSQPTKDKNGTSPVKVKEQLPLQLEDQVNSTDKIGRRIRALEWKSDSAVMNYGPDVFVSTTRLNPIMDQSQLFLVGTGISAFSPEIVLLKAGQVVLGVPNGESSKDLTASMPRLELHTDEEEKVSVVTHSSIAMDYESAIHKLVGPNTLESSTGTVCIDGFSKIFGATVGHIWKKICVEDIATRVDKQFVYASVKVISMDVPPPVMANV
ncbi:unnamed protein product, partial [Cuscuta epithymum]